jgi:hypothetical protein
VIGKGFDRYFNLDEGLDYLILVWTNDIVLYKWWIKSCQDMRCQNMCHGKLRIDLSGSIDMWVNVGM